ncbi:cbb3-type cytochrome c oxidase subunit I, partial [Planococcus sp. SIMBA_143]
VPSLMTAFSLFATFEIAGRKKGAKGLFGWFRALPWKDARFFAPMVGMLIFIPAGAGGIINASNQMNQIVHNTLWVTG